MAGAFSGHLLDSFKQSSTPIIVTSGAMSFSPQAHGSPAMAFGNTPFTGPSEETAIKIATLQAKLNQKLGPEFISQRPGPGGGQKLTYAEGWKIINLANEVFGFNGWSSSIVNMTTDFMDYNEESRRYNVGITAIVRVTLRDGAYHEDVGYGLLENSRSKGAALDKCKKEAVTDALKRTLRNFGNLLGNCLYDKTYAQEVVKIKVPPAKFNKDELYRRPEFADPKPALPSEPPPPPALAQHPQAGPSNPGPTREENPPAKPESASEQAEKPIAYIPRHLRQDVAPSTIQQATSLKEGFSVQRTKEPPLAANRPGAQQPTGLHTPIQTPAQRIPAQARRHNEQSPLARQQPQKRREISAEAAEGEYDSPVDLPSLGGEENYGLNSEDDAFLAAVDLGDGDLGRPIDFEEGIGGVSVMDDSSLDQEQSTRSAVAKSPVIQHPRVNVDSATRSSESSAQIRRAVTLPNRGTTGRVDSGSSSSSSAASNAVGAASAVSTTSGLPGRHPGALKVTHTTSGNRSPMQPLLQKSSLPPQAQRPTNHRTVPPTTGVKRNADAMQGSSSSLRPPVQGAGHTRQPQQNTAAVRRPLVSPDPMASVEFKRMKR